MSSHWGEIPTSSEGDAGIAAMEMQQMMKLRAFELEGPRLHQPSSRHYPPTNETLPAEKFQIDPLLLHTIQLLQHARKLRSLINSIHHQQQQQDPLDFDVIYPDTPPTPVYAGTIPEGPKLLHPVPFMPKEFESDFVRGVSEPLPKIDENSTRRLLRRSVAAIISHSGYDSCAESILETMTDLTHEYYLQFTKHLRAAADNLAQHQSTGFPDIIEQVFHEMGIGSVTCLHDFYQKRVISYVKQMGEVCSQLEMEYEKLKEQTPQQKPPDTLSVIRIREEPSEEIRFPVLDEIDEVNDAEQLLNLENLGGFEITVEHESASGLTTEVESKWTHVKSESAEPKVVNIDSYEDPACVKDVPSSTPNSCSEPDDIINDPASVSTSDIMSPPSVPRKKKKS